MRHAPSATRRPPHRDLIVEEDPDCPLPPRHAALQALAEPVAPDARSARLVPLAIAGLALTIGWLILPDEAPTARLILLASTLAYAGAAGWSLWSDVMTRAAQAGNVAARPVHGPVPRHVERFMQDGIAASRRRGRTAALMRLTFVIPNLLIRDQDTVIETIGEAVRDVTRAYDDVYVPGDGTILVFIAHLPEGSSVEAIARRIVTDLQMGGGPATVASRIELQSALLADAEELAGFVMRLASEPIVRLRG